ncbi:hypothetical protein ACKWTF_008425 [Chironomus riparius]
MRVELIIVIIIGTLKSFWCDLTELKCDEIKALSYYERYYGIKCTISDAVGDSSSTFVIRTANNYEYNKLIQEVEFSTCKFYDIPKDIFPTFPYLKKAQANNCGIEDITKYNFQYASELLELRMRSNKIKKLPHSVFSQMTSIITIDLSANQIEEIQNEAFAGITKLQTLTLSDNRIVKLDENLFRDLSSLMYIRLDSNKLQVIDEKLFASALNLTEIRLDSNEIAIINGDAFGALKNLKFLNLGNNRLLNVRLGETKIERLFIPYNKLTHLDINKNLKLLYAPYNDIATINFNGNTEIVEIKLRQNSVSDISNFTAQTKVEVLDLSYNPINTLNISSFSRMSDLVKLNLEYTNITSASLTFGTFAHNFNLSQLDLSYNQLRKIDFQIFTALNHLTHLKIDGNNLTEIPYEQLKSHYFPKLSLISINDNDWNCTYLSSMIKSLKLNNIIVFIFSKMRVYDLNNVDGIRCVPNNTQHIHWDTAIEHLDDQDLAVLPGKKSPKDPSFSGDLTSNLTRIWNRILEIESAVMRIDDTLQFNKGLSAFQEALTSNNNEERDILVQSEVGFIKTILIFMCFLISIIVFVVVAKSAKEYIMNHRIYFPSDNLRRSTTTIQTAMEHVM